MPRLRDDDVTLVTPVYRRNCRACGNDVSYDLPNHPAVFDEDGEKVGYDCHADTDEAPETHAIPMTVDEVETLCKDLKNLLDDPTLLDGTAVRTEEVRFLRARLRSQLHDATPNGGDPDE